MARILIIDDERSVRNSLKETLEHEGYEVDVALDAKDGISKLSTAGCDFVLCDVKYSEVGGDNIIEVIHSTRPYVQVMMTSSSTDIDSVIDLMRRGAADFITKPINLNKLLNSIKGSMDSAVYGTEEKTVKPRPVRRTKQNTVNNVDEIVGESAQINKVKALIDRVGASEARVLITGPNGTGKELVAKWLHEKSSRASGPFVEVNCAAIPSELIESELFGHEKGAFTSAIKQRKGKFEQADGGTLFLDEIGDMSLAAQAKVLRALQENRISRVGSDKDITVNVRVVTATNKNLYEEIGKCNFREDLYHRLSVITIRVPALNERLDDIPLLVDSFLMKICDEYGIPLKRIAPEAVKELQKMKWPGNVRQLRNVVERLIVLSEDSITLEDVKNYAED